MNTENKLFHNEADMRLSNMRDTLEIARRNGFDVWHNEDDGKTTCGKAGSAEAVEVFPDGSWQYKDSGPENEAAHVVTTGINAAFLRLFCFNTALYLEQDSA